MLIALCGRPKTVVSRLPPGVLKPGSSGTKSSTLRDVSGISEICLTLTVTESADDCVCTISAPADTCTTSARSPTSSVARTVAGVAAFTFTLLRTARLKPVSEMLTSYVPGLIAGMLNVPFSDVTALNVPPVPMFFTMTSAPGIRLPEESTTVPDSDEVMPPCPNARA